MTDRPEKTMPAEAALNRLMEGNGRFYRGECRVVSTPEQVARLGVQAQHPFAVIIGCADSRVSPELLFNCGLGELFVVRTAGNVLSDFDLGSVEYAVTGLGVLLVLVVGHSNCGAVAAAVAGGTAEGKLGCILKALEPAIREAKRRCRGGEELTALTEEINIHRGVAQLRQIPLLQGVPGLKILGAKYDTLTGRVALLEP